MASDKFVALLTGIADYVLSLSGKDSKFRAELRGLAQAVLEATEEAEQSEVTEATATVEDVAVATVKVESDSQMPDILLESPPLPELTLGRKVEPDEPPTITYPAKWATSKDDLPLIETRCRLKAEGARWAATRQRLLREGADFYTEIEPHDRDIISRAKAIPDCFLWMCHNTGPTPDDPGLYENVAGCFEATADVIAVIRQIGDEPDIYEAAFEQSLDLFAEALSALRVSIVQIDGPIDSDQSHAFNWLRTTTSEQQVFVQRHMRVTDPADPMNYSDLLNRIEALDASIEETRRRGKQRKKLLGKIRHKVSLILDNPQDAEDHWRILIDSVDTLVTDGLPPSNRELRELLVPAIELLPEDTEIPETVVLVLREIDRYLASCPPPEKPAIPQSTPEVQAVARLLKNKSMVLIGGDRRAGACQALTEAFALEDLIWIPTREHQSIDGFEPSIAQKKVSLVLLAIRWSSHSYTDVKDFCDRYGKPLVRLPGGYNPNQVAMQIMKQASERLQEITNGNLEE